MTSKRSYQPELIDLGPEFYTQQEYCDCLHQLARIGRLLGGDQATLKQFSSISNIQSILDVGCGGGQFTLKMAQKFPEAQVTGIDICPQAIEFALNRKAEAKLENVFFEQPLTKELNYPDRFFDVVTATLVCHHMDDVNLIEFLKKSCQIAAKKVVINDLHRHWLAYQGFSFLAKPLFSNRLIFHDGRLSIKKGFKKADWISYLQAANIPLHLCSIKWHWAFRWTVSIDTHLMQR